MIPPKAGYTYEAVTNADNFVTSVTETNASGDVVASYKLTTSGSGDTAAYTGEYEKTVYGTGTREVYSYSVTGGLESYEKYSTMTVTSAEVSALTDTAFADGVTVEIPTFMSDSGSFAFGTKTTGTGDSAVTTTDYAVLVNNKLDGTPSYLDVICTVAVNGAGASDDILKVEIKTTESVGAAPISTFTYDASGNMTSLTSYEYNGAVVTSMIYKEFTYSDGDVATETVYEYDGDTTSTKTVTTYSSGSTINVVTQTTDEVAIVWDEDHDKRIIPIIEKIYHQGLLPKFIIFGERKGTFTALIADSITESLPKPDIMILDREISYISQHENNSGDSWPAVVTNVSSARNEIIADASNKVSLYLSSLSMLWNLGIKDIDYSEQEN